MIEEIKHNIVTELAMAHELSGLIDRAERASDEERRIILGAAQSIQERIKMLNRSVGSLLASLSVVKKLPGKDKPTGVERVTLQGAPTPIALRTADKEKYLTELSISEKLLHKLKHHTEVAEQGEEYKRPNSYVQTANKFFLRTSTEWLDRGLFKNLNIDLRKANLNILTASYVSSMILSTLLAFVGGTMLTIFFLFVKVALEPPFISLVSEGYFVLLGKTIWFTLLIPLLTFGLFYFYPAIERKSLARQIDSELPFVVIHMGSIAGSGVEPTQIFKIVGLSRDYKHTRGEIRKLLNQVNVYGYDLITALKNISRLTPSTRLAELFNGLATTISSGGDLKTFFEKRAESLLLQYRIEREKFSKVAETFMDLYISVVIAAPMILLLLLIMISVSGVNIGGLQPTQMTALILVVVAAINVVFLWVITLKQPSY